MTKARKPARSWHFKAWRRLKDKGFRFDGYDVANRSDGVICGQVYFKAGNYDKEEIKDNLNLLFNNTNAKGE